MNLFVFPVIIIILQIVRYSDCQRRNIICRLLTNVQCDLYSKFQNCGTDGITYFNPCHFAQGRCNNDQLHIAHSGSCVRPEVKSNYDLILQVVCNDVKKLDCTREKTSAICASNSITYANYCYFEKVRCNDHTLHVKHSGRCSSRH